MSLELLIYLADVSENVGTLALVFAVICTFASVALFGATMDETIKTWKYFLWSFTATFFLCLTFLVAPTKETIYSIAAIKMGREISKNEKVLETSDKIYKILNQKLDEILDEKKK